MALTKSFSTNMGFEAPSAYIRIASFAGDNRALYAYITVHVDAAARHAELTPVCTATIEIPIPNGCTVEEMYLYLKTLPDFVDAEDC